MTTRRSPQQAETQSKKGTLVGLVRDLEGQPVAGAEVTAVLDAFSLASPEFWRMMPIGLDAVASAKSGADGGFRLEVEHGPLYSVTATKDGALSNEARVHVDRPFALTLGANASGPQPNDHRGPARVNRTGTFDAPVQEYRATDEEDEKPAQGRVLGQVVDAKTGNALSDVVFRRAWKDRVLARSDGQGNFSLPWTEKSTKEPVFVFAKGHKITAIPTSAFRSGEDTRFDMRLEPGIGVTGRIVDEDGKPVRDVVLICEDDIVFESTQYGAIAWRTTTDEDGKWSFEELGPGSRYWVRGFTKDTMPIDVAEGRLAADAKASIAVPTFVTGPRSSIEGVVKRRDGTPIVASDAAPAEPPKVHYLRLYDHGPAPVVMAFTPWVPIEPNGSYRIPGLAPGAYELAFWVDADLEVEVRTIRLDAGTAKRDNRIDVEVGPGREYSGKVVDEAGHPIDAVLLRAIPDFENEYMPLVPPGKPDHPGRYLQGNVRVLTKPDGTYLLTRIRSHVAMRLLVQKEGYATKKLLVPSGQEPPKTITLERTR
ncbi:MAG: hypothetical protein KDC95_08150 [Planctomycetes bacterium]|nr:hypothetical protein [Planctomycetota bacterium]